MKNYLALFFLLFPFFVEAQTDSTHWTQLINQPRGNYLMIKSAFENEQIKTLNIFKAEKKSNTSIIEKDSLGDIKENKEGFYNLFKRWEYFMLPRLDENGNYDNIQESQNWKKYLDNESTKKKQYRVANIANWQPLGPYKATSTAYANSGRVECIAFHPTDANTFYIGAPNGGVWKTIDGGVNWQYLSQNWGDQDVSSLTIHPTNPSIIFALKYNYYLLKSSDAGVTWSQINFNSGNYAINKLLINPTNPLIMLANTYGGILRSINGGNTWTKNTFSGTYNIEDLKFKPNDPTVVYANSSKIVYKSIDGGITFNSIYTLPTSSIAVNIAVTPIAPNNLYVAYNSNNLISSYSLKFGAIYKSTDSGITFNTITDENTPTDSQTMGTQGNHQGRYDLTLAVSPTNANEIWLGLTPMFKSVNGGASWNSVGSNGVSVHVDHHVTEYQPITGKLFIGCDGGLYRYTHLTDTYEILDGMNITQMYRIGGLANEKDKILYGAQDNGTHKWESNAYKSISGGDGMECIIDYSNMNTLYSSIQNGNLYKSINNGVQFSSINPNPFPSYASWVTPWEMDGNNSQILYACYKEVYKSTNGGTTWNAITNFNLNQSVIFIKITPSNTNILYAFSGGSYGYVNVLMKSLDAGVSWSVLNLPLTNFAGYDLAINATDPNKIWLIGQSKVYNSIDGGVNWTNITGTLPSIGFNCILFDKSSSDLYLGTTAGVFVRPNGATDWTFFNDGLPKVNVQELEISYSDGNLLRAATYGRGLWETSVYTPCSVPVASITASGSTVIVGGGTVTLQANTGSGLTYQWFRDGIKLIGSTNSSYVATDIGLYKVLVKNTNCSKYSNTIMVSTSATLVLNIIPSTICRGSVLSIPFTATNFAIGTIFTAEMYDITNDTYIYFTASGTTSPMSISIPSSYNLYGSYKIRLKATFPSVVTISNNFQVKSVETGIGNENGNLFSNSGYAAFDICTGKTTKLYALKYNNTMPSSTFNYQWKLNGIDIVGATDSTWTLNTQGQYSVNISQSGCSQTTPTITIYNGTYLNPTLRAVGSNVQCSNVLLESFYKTTTSTFQWKKDGIIIPSANSFSYNATSSGFYTLNVSDGSGCTINPVSREVKIGKILTSITSYDSLICNTNGYGYIYLNLPLGYDSPPNFISGITYQWQKNGTNITNATRNYYYAASSEGGGAYTLKVKQQTCEAISNPFFVRLANTLPVYATMSSYGTTFCTGQSVGLSGLGSGTFTWQKDGVDILNSSYYNATASGNYTLRRVQGSCTSTSTPISLTFGNSYIPNIYLPYNLSKSCLSGYNLNLSNSAPSGSTYQWRKNGVNISGATNNYYPVTATGNYDLVVSGACSGVSNVVPLTLGTIEAEIIPSLATLFCKNSIQKLSLNKVDYNNSQIQWKKNGVAITGATLTELLADSPASYTATITQGTCTFTTLPYVIPVRQLSTAILSGTTTITGGQTGVITANLTGLPPWGITLSDGILRYATSTPFVVSLSPSVTQTYTIQSLTDGCALGCIPKWNITSASNVSWETYHALQMIDSISKIINPANTEYRAGETINLSPGFDTQTGTVFKADIGGCNN